MGKRHEDQRGGECGDGALWGRSPLSAEEIAAAVAAPQGWAAAVGAAVAVLLPHPGRVAPPPAMVAQIVAVADVFDAGAPATTPARTGPDATQVAFAAWLAGALGAAGFLGLQQARFVASLG